MTLLLNNDDVRQLLTMEMTIDALDRSYRGTITGETVCRPRIDIEIPTRKPGYTYRWGTMEGGSSDSGYFAIRMKSDVIYYSEYAGVRTEEKFASRPGLFCGLVMLFDVQNAEPLAMINEGYLQHFRVGADAGIGTRYMAREDAHVVGIFGSGGWRAHTSRRCGASARSIASRSSVPRGNIARPTLKRWPSCTTSRPSPWMTPATSVAARTSCASAPTRHNPW